MNRDGWISPMARVCGVSAPVTAFDAFPRIDAIRALEKAARAIDRFMPTDMDSERAAILHHLKAALARLGQLDDHRVCRRCGKSFVFTVASQKAFAERGLTPPRHCPTCRDARKQERIRAGRPTWPEP